MKIAIVGPVYPFRGGIAHHTAQLAQAFARRGHQVQVFSFRRQYPAWLYPGVSDRDPSAHPLAVNAAYLLDPLYPWTWARTRRQIARFAPRLLVFQWWITFWGPAYTWIARRLDPGQTRRVFLIHNVFPHEPRPWDRWLARRALVLGDGHIAQSQQEERRLRALLPAANITRCQMPIYDLLASQRLPRQEARQALELPQEEPVLLFFGLVRPYKGLHHLLEAVAQLAQQGERVRLLVVGEFWERKAPYLQVIERLGIAGQVTLVDRYVPNEELPRYFSAADIFVAPYTAGTQSAAVTTALGYGLPLILSQTIADSAPEEMIAGSVFTVPPGEPAALAEAIRKTIAHLRDPDRASHTTPPPATEPGESWQALVEAIEAFAPPDVV